ncbi:MAG TPA: DUF502 domain-containing protein [Gemmatimonadales bacterium]
MSDQRRSLGRRLRRYLITGLVVIAPVGVTVWVLWAIFQAIDGLLGEPLQALLKFHIPGLGFLLLAVFLMLVGWLVRRAAGRQLLHWWNEALVRLPLTRRLYGAASQVIQAVVGSNRRVLGRTVVVPFPTQDSWALGFVTNETPLLLAKVLGEPCVTVFVPTTPNPTSGMMLIVPVAKLRDANLTIDEAIKLIISAGAVGDREPAVAVRRGLDLDSLLKDSIG